MCRLSVVILKDQEAAVRASVLFCFNPASIFYSSIYSETLFTLFSVGGLYHLMSGKDVIAVLWFALSGFSRSNGVLNTGYFFFQTMHQAYDAVFLRKRPFAVVGGALCCICIFVPFIAFQAYGYNNLCLGHLPSDVRPWCKARVPLLYNYIQSHYWLLLVSYPSPPLYWFASYIMKSRGIGKRWGYIVWAYSAAYILLGSLLFSNFYPFT
ncbi:unnamed protein product [Malus baccata var. baccata]